MKGYSVSELRTLLSGTGVGESPRWHDDRLWFADWSAHEVVAVDLEGASEVVVLGPSHPFCFDFLPDGRLIIVSGQQGRLLRREADGELVTHGDLRGVSRGYWNDIVVDGRGNAYVNDVGFDLLAGEEAAAGSVAVVAPDGSARRVADNVAFPNGMAVTPDNATLIVAESYTNRLTAFEIAADGSLSNRRVWADLAGGTPDGICIDAEGAVWYADVPNKRCVRVREGGQVLQTIQLDRGCFACTLGGADDPTLFMVAAEWLGPRNMFEGPRTGQVLTAHAPAPSAGWP
jgi:sugar lactone lactonase YvrE